METAESPSRPHGIALRAAAKELARELGSSSVVTAVERTEFPLSSNRPFRAREIESLLEECRMQVQPIPGKQVDAWVRPGTVVLGLADDGYVVLAQTSRRQTRETVIDSIAVSRRRMRRKHLAERVAKIGSPRWLAISLEGDLDDVASSQSPMPPWRRLRALAAIEKRDLWVVAVYAATLGLLTLVTPIATQALVSTIAFGAVLQPLVVLTIALVIGLGLAGSLAVLQAYIVEVLQRRVLVRFAEDLGRRFPRVSEKARDHRDLVELNNRFLDVITVQKSAAELLLVGFGLALQTGVGMLLLAFYHPALLAFALLLVGGLISVVLLGRGGTTSAIAESKAKYAIVGWLDELARAPHLFAAGHGSALAADRTAQKVHSYVRARRAHYRHVFSVLVGGVALQVVCLVALLAVGGFLVIERQLTLGQLIAAELVVGAIAVGLGKLGRLADKTFELVAATDKLGQLLDLPLRKQGADPLSSSAAGMALVAEDLALAYRSSTSPPISLRLSPGEKLLLTGDSGSGKTILLETLAGQRPPEGGKITWDGRGNPRLKELSSSVQLASSGSLIGGTILDNLRLADLSLGATRAWEVLEELGLAQAIDELGGLDCRVLPSGAPLSSSQQRRLVLARALVARPRLLLIDEALDFLARDDADVSRLHDLFLGSQAPWTAVVVSHDPRLRRRLESTLSISGHDRSTSRSRVSGATEGSDESSPP